MPIGPPAGLSFLNVIHPPSIMWHKHLCQRWVCARLHYTCQCCVWKARASSVQSITLWLPATIEIMCHNHSSHTLAVAFNHPHIIISRDYTPPSLYYCLLLFFAHIPFVVNHTFNATGKVATVVMYCT